MPLKRSLIQEYLKDPPRFYTPTIDLLLSNQENLIVICGGKFNFWCWKLFLLSLSAPLHYSLVKLQLVKMSNPLRLHQSSETIDDFSFSSKSQETFSLLLQCQSPEYICSSEFPYAVSPDSPAIARKVHFMPILADCFLTKDGIVRAWKGWYLHLLRSVVLDIGVMQLSYGIMRNFSTQLNRLQFPFKREYLVFVGCDAFYQFITSPMEMLYVRNVNSSCKASSLEIVRNAVKKDGIEGLFPNCLFSIFSYVVASCCKVLPSIVFEFYFERKINFNSRVLDAAAGFLVKQTLLVGFLAFRIPLEIIRRRLYSGNIYYSKETENPYGLLSCLKGMLFEEGVSSFHRGFWFCYLKENFQCLVQKSFLSKPEQ